MLICMVMSCTLRKNDKKYRVIHVGMLFQRNQKQGTAGCHLHTDGRTHPVSGVNHQVVSPRPINVDFIKVRFQ